MTDQQQSTTGFSMENVRAGGNITVSGVTIQNITQMPDPPPLWINVPLLPNHFLGRDDLVADLVARLCAGASPALSAEGLPGVGSIGCRGWAAGR